MAKDQNNETKKEIKSESKSSPKKAIYQRLLEVDVSKDVKTRGQNGHELSYLSWAAAYDNMMKFCPSSSYRIAEFDANGIECAENEHGYPFQKLPDGAGYNCKVYVTIEGETKSISLPVMDSRNLAVKDHPYLCTLKPGTKYEYDVTVPSIDSCLVNKAQMRCFVKCLALFGLGINVYMGDDLPDDDPLTTVNGVVVGEYTPETLEPLVTGTKKEEVKETSTEAPKKVTTGADVNLFGNEEEKHEAESESQVVETVAEDTDNEATDEEELKIALEATFVNPNPKFNGKKIADLIFKAATKEQAETSRQYLENFACRATDEEDKKNCKVLLEALKTGAISFAESCK